MIRHRRRGVNVNASRTGSVWRIVGIDSSCHRNVTSLWSRHWLVSARRRSPRSRWRSSADCETLISEVRVAEDCYTSRGDHRLPSLDVGKTSHSIALFHNHRTFPTLVCHSSNNSENQFDDANKRDESIAVKRGWDSYTR